MCSSPDRVKSRPIELVFTAFVIFQLYHGENKLIFDWDDDDEVRFVLDKHAKLDF
jgi:hypothetical protein